MSFASLKIDRPSVNITFGKPCAKATWSYGGSTPAYSYGGNTYNASGYLANPSRSAQIQARDAGALTNYEASRMGLSNRR